MIERERKTERKRNTRNKNQKQRPHYSKNLTTWWIFHATNTKQRLHITKRYFNVKVISFIELVSNLHTRLNNESHTLRVYVCPVSMSMLSSMHWHAIWVCLMIKAVWIQLFYNHKNTFARNQHENCWSSTFNWKHWSPSFVDSWMVGSFFLFHFLSSKSIPQRQNNLFAISVCVFSLSLMRRICQQLQCQCQSSIHRNVCNRMLVQYVYYLYTHIHAGHASIFMKPMWLRVFSHISC